MTIAYEAYNIVDEEDYWVVCIEVAEIVSPDASAKISVRDRNGKPISKAKLFFGGVVLDMLEGEIVAEFGLFIRNLANPEVSLVYPDGKRIEGTLKFGDLGVTKHI